MTRAELISAVALRMDEITPTNGVVIGVDGSDNNPLSTLINGLIDAGVLELYSIAPYWRLPQTAFVYDDEDASKNEILFAKVFTDTAYERWIIRLKVNDKFLRVAEIPGPWFNRPIVEVFPEQSEEGRRQHNPYLVGKEVKPVGVMSHGIWSDDSHCREIDCYSLSPDTLDGDEMDNVVASYIAKPNTISDTVGSVVSVESVVPPVLIPALEWLIAARTFGARGDTNHAAICQQNAQNLLV